MVDMPQDWRAPVKQVEQFMGYSGRVAEPFRDFPAPQQGRPWVILGGRKAGKTSVLHMLAHALGNRPRTIETAYLVPVYITLDAPAITSREEAYQRLVTEFFSTLKKEPLRLCVLQEQTVNIILRPSTTNTITINSFINAVRYLVDTSRTARDMAGQVIGELRLIGLLDNADDLAAAPWLSEFLSDLGALFFGNLAMEANLRLDLVIASRGPFYDSLAAIRSWQEKSDELRVMLEPLSAADVTAWLSNEAAGLSDLAVQAITRWCGGHPYVVRHMQQQIGRACSHRWETVDVASIDDIAREQVESLPVLVDWIAELTDAARAAWRMLVDVGPAGLNALQLRRQLRQSLRGAAPQEIARGVDQLLWTGIVQRDPSNPAVLLPGGQLIQEYLELEPATTAGKPGDMYARYEAGLQRLLESMGPAHSQYAEALVFQTRLIENINRSRLYGDTSDTNAQRNEIIAYLNDLALATCGVSFFELCRTA